MYDTVVYRHFLAHGGGLPDVREALAQRVHDAGIDNALGDAVTRLGRPPRPDQRRRGDGRARRPARLGRRTGSRPTSPTG